MMGIGELIVIAVVLSIIWLVQNAGGGRSMKYRLLILWLSCQWALRVNLGDLVWYRGRRYMVCNGVMLLSWEVQDLRTGTRHSVARRECRKVKTPSNLWGSMASGYRFYMTNWLEIWK